MTVTRTTAAAVQFQLVANPAITLNSTQTSTLQLGLSAATNRITALLGRSDRTSLMTGIFGTAGTASSTFSSNLTSLFTLLSGTGLKLAVEVRSAAEMNGASAAYAPNAPGGVQKVYLNADLLSNGTTSEQITWLLLENFAHALDRRLNGNLDAAGDEGKAFAQALTGRSLTAAELPTLGRDAAGGVVNIAGMAVAVESEANAGPSVSATASNGSFSEAQGLGTQAAAVAVFSGANVSVGGASETWQTISTFSLRVAGLRDGANERLWIDGQAISLGANASGVTSANGLIWTLSLSADVASLSFSRTGGISSSALAGLINGLAYQNTNTDNPTAGNRSITITSLSDSGGAVGGGTGTTNPNLTSTITVIAVNDAPQLGTLAGIDFTDTAAADSFAASSGSLMATDPEGSTLSYGLTDAIAANNSFDGLSYDLSKSGTYGTLYLSSSNGNYRFQPKSDWQLNALSVSGSDSFNVSVSDGVNTSSSALLINFSGVQDAPEQYVVVDDGAPLLTTAAQALWEQALTLASRYLSELLSDPDRDTIFNDVFGRAGTDPATFEANKQTLYATLGGSGLRIDVDLRSDAELNGALAAYAAVGHTGIERLYVNGDKLNSGALDLTTTVSALLEEFGHAMDVRLNGNTDSPGDEGQLFASEVTGVVLTADQRALIDAEDDTTTLVIQGISVPVELGAVAISTSVDNADGGSGQADQVTITNNNLIQASDVLNGGAADSTVDEIIISGTTGVSIDLSLGSDGTFLNWDGIKFNNTSGTSTATIRDTQFQGAFYNSSTLTGRIATNALFTGNTGIQSVIINVTAGNSFDASAFTFSTWTSGTDLFAINGSTGNERIVGSTQSDAISGGSGDDTLDGSNGNDTLTGGAGTDVFITSATAGSSTVASATSLGSAGSNIAAGNTLTFANGVDIVLDFTVGTDLLSGRTASNALINLVGTANNANLATGTGYYAYGNWNANTNVFTFASSWVSSTSDDLIFVVGDSGTLTPATSNGYTILTNISGSIDTTAPTISSFSTTSANGSYKAGDTINITATASEPILAGGQITVTLSSGAGATVTLTADSTGNTLTGTYTIAPGQNSADLTVSSFTIGTGSATPRDAAFGNALTSTTVPSGTNNIAGSYAIVVDTTAPTVSAISASGTGFTTINLTSNEAGTAGLYNTSGGALIGSISTLAANTANSVTASEQATLTTASLIVSDAAGNTTTARTVYLGSASGESITGTSADEILYGFDGSDTIDGGIGDDIMIGGAGVDFFITSATAGSSTVASATSLGTAGANIGATTSTLTFANGVDIILDFAVGTDILSGRNTQTLINLFGTANNIDLTTNRGYYSYGSWNASTNVFTFAASYTSGTNDDLIFVVGDSGTLTPATSNGYTILTNISGSIDTTAPTISSFSTTSANGSYKAGDTINITATASEPILAGGQITVTLSSGAGATVTLTADSTGNTLTGTYTIAPGQNSADLTVSSFTIGTGSATPRDAAFGNALTSTTVPSGTNNIAGSYAIVVDTTAPTVSAISASGTGFTTINLTSNEAGTAGLYNTSGGALIGSISTLAANTANSVTASEQATLTTASLIVSDAAGNTTTARTVYLGSASGESITGTSADEILYGFDGSDTIDGGIGDDIMIGGAGVDFFITSATAGSSTVASATSLGTAGANIGATTSTLTFANGVDIILDFAVGTDILSGRNTQTLINLFGTANNIDLTTNRGYYSYGSWNASTNVFTFAASYTSGTNDDLIFVVGDSGTLTPATSNGYTILTNISGSIDTTAPTISSFSTTSANGSYKAGDTINITATASEPILAGGQITVTLSSGAGATVTLTADSTGNTLTGTYTIAPGQNSADLTVSSFTIGTGSATPRDAAFGNALTSTTVPSGTNNIAGSYAIVVDTTAPTVSAISASGTGFTTINLTSNEAGTAGLYNTSGGALIGSISTLAANTANSVTASEQATLTTASLIVSDAAGNTTTARTVYLGSASGESITGTSADEILYGFDGSDTIDGGIGDDIMIGGAGVDFFITSATAGSSTVASATSLGTAGANIGATTSTLTFANGVDIILDFAVGTDILSGRNTQTLINLFGTANNIDLTTNRGYYSYGSWNASTNVFTFAASYTSGTNDDLIFVVGDSGTLTPATSNGYTILTNISGSIDTTAPTISSFSTTSANGSYKAGDTINITATASEPILAGGQITVTLSSGAGATVTLTADSTGNTLTGTYTIAPGQNSADLTVSSFTIGSGSATPRDAAFGNALTSTTVPSGTNNIAGSYAIVVDTTAPTVSAISASGTGFTTINLTSNEAGTAGLYNTSGGALIGSISTLAANTANSVTASEQATLTTASLIVSDAAGNTTTARTVYLGSASGESITGTSADEILYGFDGSDTIDGGIGDDIMIGGAGVDFFITSATAGSSTVASATSLGTAGANIGATTSTLTFANGVDIILDFAVGTDILSGRNTQTLINLFGTANNIDLTTNRGYYSYGSWNASTNVFTFAASYTSGTNDDLIFVVGDSGTLTPATSNGYTILTNISGSIDTTAPTISSFSTTSANGSYKAGDTINITATASEPILAGGQITVTLSSGAGATVTLTADSTGNTLTGTYTIAPGQNSADLTVSSFTIGSGSATPRDAAFGNALTSTTVPSGTNNIAGSYAIVVDTTAPTVSAISASGTGFTTINLTSNEAGTAGLYNTSGGALIGSISTLAANTANSVTASEQATLTTASLIVSDAAGNTTTARTVYLGSASGESITGTSADEILYGFDGSDTIDGGIGDDIMIGGAGVDFFITSATAGSSTVASATSLGTAGANIGATTSTLTFANGVDIILDFAVGTDILSGRNTQTLINLFGTANNIDLTTNRGYYSYGSWNASTNVFTFAASYTSGTNDDLIFVVGDSGTLTPATSNGYTILTNISGSIDTTAPTISSFSTTSANGSYKAGDTINITATASEPILAGGQITVTLSSGAGATVTLTADSTGNTLTGTYTIAPGQNSADLTVSSFTIGTGSATPRDAAFGNALTSTTVPSGTNNIAGSYAIVVDTTAPAALTLTAPADSGTSGSDGITKNNSFSISSPEANSTWQFTIDNGVNWSIGNATSFIVADGSYSIGAIQVRQIDAAGNISPATSSTAAFTVDTSAAAPSLSITDTGSSTSDRITSNTTITVSGVETGATWQYSTDSGSTWSAAQAATITSFTVAAGTYITGQVQVKQTDAAGNNSAANTTFAAFTVDTSAAAPSLSITDTGSSTSDRITSNTTITVSGVETGATWQYSTDSGSTWSAAQAATITSFTVAAGTYITGQVQVKQTDAAGNNSAANTTFAAFTVDTSAAAPSLSITDTGSSTSDRITSNTTITVSGVETGATWQYSTDSGSTWYAAQAATITSLTVAAGTYITGQVQVKQTDAAGNNSAANTTFAAFTVDTSAAAPSLSITDTGSSTSDRITSNTTITVSGVETGATWQYSTDSGSTWSAAQAATITSFTVAAGTYITGQVQVKQTDAAGNNSAANTTFAAFTVDTSAAAPSLSITDTGSSTSDRITSNTTITVSGVETGATWQYSTDSGSTWSAAQAATITSFTVAAGTYITGQVQVKQTDAAGNNSAANTTFAAFTVDTSAAAPSLSITDTGSSTSDRITSNTTITVSGVETGATWQYSTDSGSTWYAAQAATITSFTVAAGTYITGQVQVKQTDAAGNNSAANTTFAAFTVDTSAAAPSLSITDTGSSTSDRITSNTTITVSGVETGATWQYSTDSGGTWSAAQAATSTSFTVAAGTYTAGQVQVKQTDAAGNNSAANTTFAAFTVDTSAPAAPVISTVTDDVNPVTGTVASGGSTNDTVLVLAGTAEANSTVTLYNGSTSLGTTSANASGVWSFTTATLTNGTTYTFNATATNAAGNVSAASSSYTVTVDTAAPDAPQLTLGSGVANGASAVEATAATGVVTLTAESGASVAVVFTGTSGTVTKTVTGNGATAVAVVLASGDLNTLGNGNVAVSATATDAAGNASTAGTASFTLDTAAPNISLALGTGVSGGATALEATQVSGVVTVSAESGSSVVVTFTRGSNTVSRSLTGTGSAQAVALSSADLTTLGNGPIAVSAIATDGAGNAASTSTSFNLDTTAPTLSSISFGSNDGTLALGEAITLLVNLSEAVNVTSTTTLVLNNGGSASYFSGTGTNQITFTYSPLAGQSTTALATAASTALRGTVTDLAGNAVIASGFNNLSPSNGPVAVDVIAPTLITISYGSNDGALALGETITLVVTGSEALKVTGTPTLALNNGGTASYVSGTGTNQLLFSYTPGAVQSTADLATATSNALSGTITDLAGNSIAASVFNNINPSGTVLVDISAPTVSSVAISSAAGSQNGQLNTGDTVFVTVTMSEAVIVDTTSGSPQLSLNVGGASRTAVYASGSGSAALVFAYTIQAADSDANGISIDANRLTLNGSSIRDLAGNLLASLTHAAVADNSSYVVNNSLPQVTGISYGTNDGNLAVGESVTLLIDFDETVLVSGFPSLLLNSGGSATYSAGSGSNRLSFLYTPAAGQSTADLATAASKALSNDLSGSITDLAGNAVVATGFDNLNPSGTLAVDAIAPLVASMVVSTPNSTLVVGDQITITVSMSEAVTVSGSPQLALNLGGSLNRTASYVSGSSSSALVFAYTITADDNGASGITIPANSLTNVNGSTIKDPAGNNAVLSHRAYENGGYTVDTAAPTVASIVFSSASGVQNGTLNAGDVVNVLVTMSETVVVTGTPLLSLNVGGSSRSASYISGSGSAALLFAYTVVAGDTDANGLAIAADSLVFNNGTITDGAGNAAILTHAAVTDNASYKVDTTVPAITAVAISSAEGAQNSTLNSGDQLNVTVTMSESVTVSGIPQLSLNVGGTNRRASYLSGSGTTALVFAYVIQSGDTDANGISIVADPLILNGGSIVDSAGNNASLSFSAVADNASYRVDTTAPLATFSTTIGTNAGLTSTINSGGATRDNTLDLSGTASDAGVLSRVDIYSGDTKLGEASLSGSTWTYATTALTDGNQVFTARVYDQAGNVFITSAVNARIDTTAPGTPSIVFAIDDVVPGTANVLNGGTTNDNTPTMRVSLQGSGAVAGDTVQLLSGSTVVGSATLTSTNISDNYVNITPTLDSDGSYTFTTRITDAVGNVSQASAPFTLIIDRLAPSLPTLTLSSDTGSSQSDGITKTGTITVGGLETITTAWQYSINGGVNWFKGSGSSFTLPNGTYAVGAVQVRQADLAGNLSPVFSNGSAISVDNTAPTIAISSSRSSLGLSGGLPESATITFVLSEATDFSVSSVTVTGGSLTNFSGSGTLYTATFTPSAASTSNGVIQVGSSKFSDLAGNANADGGDANNTVTISVNTVVPAASSLPSVSAISLDLATDSGTKGDWITNSNSATFSGTLSAALGTAQKLQLSKDGSTWVDITPSGTAFTFSSSTFSGGLTASTTLQGRVFDTASNQSGNVWSRYLTIDTSTYTGSLTLLNYSGNLINGSAAGNDNSFDLSLPNPEPGATISYQRWNGSTWDTLANSNQAGLADGNYRYRAIATDVAGNTATSADLTVAIDQTAPTAPILALNNAVSEPLSKTQLTVSNGALLVTTYETGATVTVTLISDAQGSSPVVKTFISSGSTQSVVFTTSDAAVLGDGTLTANATINDPAGNSSSAVPLSFSYVAQPVVVLGELSIGVTQNGAEASNGQSTSNEFRLTRTGDTTESLVVKYRLSGSAVGGVDYVLPALDSDGLASAFFQAGSNTTTISLNTIDNAIRNTASRSISATISKPPSYNLAANASSATAFIADDELDVVVPVISFSAATLSEGSSGNWVANVDVTLSQITTAEVSVNYSFGNSIVGTLATASGSGSDYSATDGTLRWNPGTLKQTISFTVIADSAVEPDEFFFINLTNRSGATFVGGGDSLTRTITLLNDDNSTTSQDPNLGLTPPALTSAGVLNGGSLNDIFIGSDGGDTLSGFGGNDSLTGGLGADRLAGGQGTDRFIYNAYAESNRASFDFITDFSSSQSDRIILGSAIALPTKLWNLGNISSSALTTLDLALNAAYGDVDRLTSGNQVLGSGEGMAFTWGTNSSNRSLYFVLDNPGTASISDDLLIRTNGLSIASIGLADYSAIFSANV